MKCKLFFFSLIFLFSFNSKAADPEFYQLRVTTKKWEVTERSSFFEGRVSREILQRLDSIYEKSPSTYDFIYDPSSQSLKVFVHCTFDVYTLREDQLIEDYKFNNRGYTCGSYFFKRNNSFQILGARGFWNYHADLLKFDSLKGSWDFIQTKQQPLDYYQLGAYQNSKGIVTFLGEYNNPRIPRLENEANGFFLDLEKKSWQPIQLDIEEFDLAEIVKTNQSHLYETQDYALSVTTSQLPNLGWYLWILIEKETGKLYFYEGSRDTDIFWSSYYEVIGNNIRFFDYHLDSDTEGKEVAINLDSLRNNSREIGQIKLIDAREKTETASIFPLALWIGFPAVLLLGFWMGRQLQNKKKEEDLTQLDPEKEGEDLEEESGEILQRLLTHDGEKLNTEEFDTALGIHQITNFDSKRIKRSRLIKALNKQYEEKKGFPLITRIKNPEDKRFVFYKITFENGD